MSRLKLYFIDEQYINYLRKFDDRVAYNKNATRPYVGIVYKYNNYTYFAPLSSPKEKHKKMSNRMEDIWKIKSGELGIINFNNMIPCIESVLKEAIPCINDNNYKILLENQISSINSEREMLLIKINRFQNHYRKKLLSNNILERCCNFTVLEQKCNEYIQN